MIGRFVSNGVSVLVRVVKIGVSFFILEKMFLRFEKLVII